MALILTLLCIMVWHLFCAKPSPEPVVTAAVVKYNSPEQWSCWGVQKWGPTCDCDISNSVIYTTVIYWEYIGFTPSVCPSVRLSRLLCPLCNIYSSGWILSILATNDHYHERVCHTQWPLTLTYIFKVIRPWLRKSCPLCSVYSSEWILFIFGTNDHYH